MYNLYLEEKRKKLNDIKQKNELEMQKYKAKLNSKKKYINSFFIILKCIQ